jgi:hypothetical protein
MNKEDKHLDGAGLGEVWAKVKAQVSVLASGLGQVTAMAQDNAIAITAHDDRINDLESYFDGGKVLKAVGDEDGRNIKATYFPYTGGTIYKSGENYPLVIKGGNLSTVAGIEFYGSTGSLLGRLRFTNSALQYYNGSYKDVYHEGNANLASVDWACKDLNAAQDVIATRGVSAKGCSDLSIAEMALLGAVAQIAITGDSGGPYTPNDGLVTLPAYPVWSTLGGKPAFGNAAYSDKSEFTPNALAVTTKTGTSWTPDNNSTPSIMYQAITANHTLNFQTADAAGVGCVHYIVLANNTSSAKTVTIQRGSQGLAVARVSGSISVPANSALVMTYVAINQNFYVAESSVLTIDHP